MAIKRTVTAYVKPSDTFLWDRFERLAARLKLPKSTALAQAAQDWCDRHESDPTPLPPDRRRGQIIDFNPFETMKGAPVAPPRADPFAAAEKERDNT